MKETIDIKETLYQGVAMTFLNSTVIADEVLHGQRVQIVDNATFGRVLLIDGVTQLTSADEFIYHEMVAHVPLFSRPNTSPMKVLIIGGGDGCLAREILKHEQVRRLVQVEIDDAVITLSRQHLADLNAGVFEDERFESVIADGAAYLRDSTEVFDLIIVDSTDPIGPAEVLFTQPFYQNCYDHLTEGGEMLTQSGVPFLQANELYTTQANLQKTGFAGNWKPYLVPVPTYIGGQMVIISAMRGYRESTVNEWQLKLKVQRSGIKTKYYNADVHFAAFKLPEYIRDIVW